MNTIKKLQYLLNYLTDEQLEENVIDIEITPELNSLLQEIGFNQVKSDRAQISTHYKIKNTNLLRIKVYLIKEIINSETEL